MSERPRRVKGPGQSRMVEIYQCDYELWQRFKRRFEGGWEEEEGLMVFERVSRMYARNLDYLSLAIHSDVFGRGVSVLDQCRTKVVTTGMGKSGIVARMMTANLCGIGVPSVWINPAEALHGGLGLMGHEDVVVVVSKSATTGEVLRFWNRLPDWVLSVGILGDVDTDLGDCVDAAIEVKGHYEPVSGGVIPMGWLASAGAVADALVIGLMEKRGIEEKVVKWFHPAGGE